MIVQSGFARDADAPGRWRATSISAPAAGPTSARISSIHCQQFTGSPWLNKVRLARRPAEAVSPQRVGRQQMGLRSILDIGHVDKVRAVAHAPQPARAGPLRSAGR